MADQLPEQKKGETKVESKSPTRPDRPSRTHGRVAKGIGHGMGGTRADQNREFGHGDQQFGGGRGNEEYGEPPVKETPDEPAVESDAGADDETEGQVGSYAGGEEE